MPLATVQAAHVLDVPAHVLDTRKTEPAGASDRSISSQRPGPVPSIVRSGVALVLLTAFAVAIDGYHPFCDDAGIYVAGLKKLVHPALYPESGAFLAPYVRLSLFSHFGAWLLSAIPVSMETILFAIHLATTWLLLYAGYGLAKRCFPHLRGRSSGTLLIALCLSVPVAGTSLSIMDPYLTGRSFSTPFAILAFSALLDKSVWRASAFLLLATLFHPLMGAYAVAFSLVLWAVHRRSLAGVMAISASGVIAAAIIQFSQTSATESAAYRAAVATRTYFFLSEWQWYEIVGLAAPLCLLGLYGFWKRATSERNSVSLALACVVMGCTACTISLLFSNLASKSYLVASLQPLRPFLYIYFILFVLIGGVSSQAFDKWPGREWSVGAIALGCILGASLMAVQHSIYATLPQLELPGLTSHNDWHRAFDWIHINTPPVALVALDADYIHAPGEDSLGFRAVAERDSLAVRSKDGGAAAVFPQLAERWLIEQTATASLNRISDSERLRHLAPFKASWIVLDGKARTDFLCPFATEMVKVCRLQ